MTRFAGKQAIVTGAGSGIGAALCRALAAAGADVVCTDIDGEAAARTAASLTKPGTARQLDVTDAAAVQDAIDDVVARTGRGRGNSVGPSSLQVVPGKSSSPLKCWKVQAIFRFRPH